MLQTEDYQPFTSGTIFIGFIQTVLTLFWKKQQDYSSILETFRKVA